MNNTNEFDILFLLTLEAIKCDDELDLIENVYLKSIIDSFTRIPLIEKLENSIRDEIVHDFESNDTTRIYQLLQRKILQIVAEQRTHILESNEGRIDVKFFISGFDFTVECKLLKYADKKYLDEGLQRFISLKYAGKDEYAGMIGFIIKGEPEKIVEKLKKKVKKFHPTPDIQTYLDKTCANHTLSFQSKHIRSDNTEIHIFHLFFDAR